MSEDITNYEQVSASANALNAAAELYSDVAELKSPELIQATENLVSEFGIRQEYFEGEKGTAHTLLLASVASNLVQLEHDGKNPSANFQEFAAIADAAAFVALDYLTGYDDLVAESKKEAEGALSETGSEAVLLKYKSEELTAAIKEKIDDGLLDGVKEKLGITEDNEDPYEVLVLSISEDEMYTNHGIDLKVEFPSAEEWDSDPEAAKAKADIAMELSETKTQWRNDLIDRRKQFTEEYGSAVGTAFVTSPNGKTYLCISADVAELLAYDQSPELRSESYDEQEHARTLALLEHEYTHTQGITVLENHVGISLEELRAELFSGNRHGYQDVKAFFQDIRLITGFSAHDALEARVKGGSAAELYGDIAENVGLDMLYKIITVFPRNYVRDQSSTLLRNLQQATGGYDGITQELYERAVANGEKGRVEADIDKLLSVVRKNNPDFLETYLGMRSRHSGYGTNLIQKRKETTT